MAHLTMSDRSQPEFAQSGMAVRAAPQRPVIFAVGLRDRQIVDAGDAQSHESVLVELPVFIAIAAIPMAAIVVPLVGETHRYTVLAKGPHLLDQPVVQFARPLTHQERLDGLAALQELGAVAPAAIRR